MFFLKRDSKSIEQAIANDLISKEANQSMEKGFVLENFKLNEIFINQVSRKVSISSSTTNESLNYFPRKSSSQENDEYLISNQNLTMNDLSFDTFIDETARIEPNSDHKSTLSSHNHSNDPNSSTDLLYSISATKHVNSVNKENDLTKNKILTSKENNITNDFSNKEISNFNYEIITKSPKSESSRRRKLSHSISQNINSKPSSNKPPIQLAYCTRNKNINGCRSLIRVTSNTECSNSNIFDIKIQEDIAKCSDVNIIRIPSLSTIISEPEQKSFTENITSTSISNSLNENSPALTNKALLFANNSSQHLKNNSSSIFSGISTETPV